MVDRFCPLTQRIVSRRFQAVEFEMAEGRIAAFQFKVKCLERRSECSILKCVAEFTVDVIGWV